MDKATLQFGWMKKLTAVAALIFALAPIASAAPISCQDLNNPDATKSYVISIVEEQFGQAPKDDPNVFRCARETTCEEVQQKPAEGSNPPAEGESAPATQTETQCTSKYVDSCTPSDTTICQTVQVFIAQSGLELLFSYLGLIYRWAAGMIGIVSVFYLIYGGIKIATAGDNTSAIDEAKAKIIQSIAGLILLFLSAVILYTINPNFFVL
jgi:hypothetical protein